MWCEAGGAAFNPGNYYYVGGNSKFYGAVLIRYRKEDFAAMEHFGGVSPAWPFSYDEFEPWYSRAEQLFRVRGALGEDPTEPFHSIPYAFKPVPDEAPIARARAELRASACIRPRCRSASTSTLARRKARPPGTPFPTPVRARWTPRPHRWRRR